MDQTRTPTDRLTADGRQALDEICRRYGVTDDTGLTLLDALSRTNGSMAQFNLMELGGSGQWMSGGMVMVGDMFNQGLKTRVDGLCYDLAALLATQPFRPAPIPAGAGSFPGPAGQWWPAGLGTPNWQGSQNTFRYAYFAGSGRLALDANGEVAVYDTSGFTLSGVGQQQSSGYGASLTFTGPGGIVTLDRLRRLDGGGQNRSEDRPAPPPPAPPPPAAPEPVADSRPAPQPETGPAAPPVTALDERLAGSRWLYQPPAGARPLAVTLAQDGVLAGADDQSARYWAVEEAVLWFFAADGRATARFDRVIHDDGGVRLAGTSPPDGGAPVLLRADPPRPTPAPAPAAAGTSVLSLRLDLGHGDWTLAERDGRILATLRLLADGGIAGNPRPTEAAWRLDGSQLVFLHKSGRPTTRFTTITVRDGRWTLSGPSLANDRIIHELSQIDPA